MHARRRILTAILPLVLAAVQHEFTGVETNGTIFYVVESPHEKGTGWAGTDDGLVHITRNNGTTCENVTPKGIPEWIRINAIEVSPHDKGTAYVAATMYPFADYRPYLYKTNDYGRTWTKIVNGNPDTAFTRVAREDPGRRGLLFAVQSNPSLKVPADFLHAVRDDPLTLNAAVRRIKDVRLQLADLQKRADAIGKGAALKEKTEALTKKLSAIADELYNPEIKTSQDSLNYLPKLDFQISGVGGMSDGAESKSTGAALARHKQLQGQLKAILGRLDAALTQDLGAFNKAVADAGILPVVAVPREKR